MTQTHPSSQGISEQRGAVYNRFQTNSYDGGMPFGNSAGVPLNQYYNNINMYPVGRSSTHYFSSRSTAATATSGHMIPPQQNLQQQRLHYGHSSIGPRQWPPTHYPAQIRNFNQQFMTTSPSNYHHQHSFVNPYSPPFSQQQNRPMQYCDAQQSVVYPKEALDDNWPTSSYQQQTALYNTGSIGHKNTISSNVGAQKPSPNNFIGKIPFGDKVKIPKIKHNTKKPSKHYAKKGRKPPIPSFEHNTDDYSRLSWTNSHASFQVPRIKHTLPQRCEPQQLNEAELRHSDSLLAPQEVGGDNSVPKKKINEELIRNKTIKSPCDPIPCVPTQMPPRCRKKSITGKERQIGLVPIVAPEHKKKKNKTSEQSLSAMKNPVRKLMEELVNDEVKKPFPPYHQRNYYTQTPPESDSEDVDYRQDEATKVEPQIVQSERPTVGSNSVSIDSVVHKLCEARDSLPMLEVPSPDAFEVDDEGRFSPVVYIPLDAPTVQIPSTPINSPSEASTTTTNSFMGTSLDSVVSPVKMIFKEHNATVPDEAVSPHSENTSFPVEEPKKKFPIVPPLMKSPAPLLSEFMSLPLILEPTRRDDEWQTVSRKRGKYSISLPSARSCNLNPEPAQTPLLSTAIESSSKNKESKKSRRRRKLKKQRSHEKRKAAEVDETLITANAAEKPSEEIDRQRRTRCDCLRKCLVRVLPTGWRKEKTN